MVDSGEHVTEIDPASQVVERLNKGESFIEEGFTSFDVYKSIAGLSDKNQREYGVQLNYFPDGKGKTIYRIGEPKGIEAPDGFSNARRVFFHTHPNLGDRDPKSILNMTPSYSYKSYDQYYKGDFGNNDWAIASGSFLNNITSLGITFLIGQEKHTHATSIVAKAREKLGVANETSSPLLIFKSGQNKDRIIDYWSPEVFKENHLGNDDHLSFTVRLPDLRGDYNLLFVTHAKLDKLELTPKEICFGEGVNTLVSKLSVNLTHAANVANAIAGYQAYSPI